MVAWAPNSWIYVNFKSSWKKKDYCHVEAKILNKQTGACGIAYRVALCMDVLSVFFSFKQE